MREISQQIAEALESEEFYVGVKLNENFYGGDRFCDPENFVHNFTGKLMLVAFSGEERAEFGTFDVYQVDGDGLLAQGLSFETAYDLTADTWAYYEDLVDHDNPWQFSEATLEVLDCKHEALPSGMLIISDIDVHPEYRGRSLGLQALKCLMLRFRTGAGIVAMRPFPWQYAHGMTEEGRQKHGLDVYKGSERACLMKLRAHFAQLGFRLVPGTDVMALDTIKRWDDLEDA